MDGNCESIFASLVSAILFIPLPAEYLIPPWYGCGLFEYSAQKGLVHNALQKLWRKMKKFLFHLLKKYSS